jgi:hypothetical protein
LSGNGGLAVLAEYLHALPLGSKEFLSPSSRIVWSVAWLPHALAFFAQAEGIAAAIRAKKMRMHLWTVLT